MTNHVNGHNETHRNDVLIIGGGPAGLTAGIYLCRARINALLIEKAFFGGQMATAELVENYPGFPQGIGGLELGQVMEQQAKKFGLKTVNATVTGLEIKAKDKIVKTSAGDFVSRGVILAGGSERQKLGVPGEEQFTGHGVSYCATCDGAFFRDIPVAVIGGGNAALNEALELTKFASQITVIHRRGELRATKIEQERALSDPKIKFLWNTVVDAVEGDKTVQKLKLSNIKTGEKTVLAVSGVFVAVGLVPQTAYLNEIVPLDEGGYVITNEQMATGIPGIYAAGDIRHNSARQAVTAAGDGATAAINIEKYLAEK